MLFGVLWCFGACMKVETMCLAQGTQCDLQPVPRSERIHMTWDVAKKKRQTLLHTLHYILRHICGDMTWVSARMHVNWPHFRRFRLSRAWFLWSQRNSFTTGFLVTWALMWYMIYSMKHSIDWGRPESQGWWPWLKWPTRKATFTNKCHHSFSLWYSYSP